MAISEEAVQAAAKVLRQHYADEEDPAVLGYPLDEYECCVRAVLEAAEPFMRNGGPE